MEALTGRAEVDWKPQMQIFVLVNCKYLQRKVAKF
jgi:hypothetical protein